MIQLEQAYDKETGYALGDVLALANETIPNDNYTLVHPTEIWKTKNIDNYLKRELLVPIYKNGELVYEMPSLNERRDYCEEEFNTLYPEVTRITEPHEYYVDLSNNLRMLKNELIEKHTSNIDSPKQLVK